MTEREEALAKLDAARMCDQIGYAAYSRLHDLINEIFEQKHGHWIRSPGFRPDFQCSVCKETYVGNCRMFKFCPECGARMDEEVKQE